MLNTQTKILLLVFAGLVLVYLLYNGKTENFEDVNKRQEIDNSNNIPENIEHLENVANPQIDNASSEGSAASRQEQAEEPQQPLTREDMIKYFPPNDYAPPEGDWLQKKFNSRNKARSGEFKRSSYGAARRGALGPSDWDDYFDHNNNVIGNSQTGDNDKFLPIDETNGGFAVFKSKGRATCGSNQNCEPEDLFDVDKYLPQEVNDDWFEVQPEPISVKNRHLINITKPIGVNTIGTSLKNASHDIRGSPACPKFVVSPFLNSSIEPDVNLKPLM
ncbi:hypothetical protein QKU48_gp0562 [Fadolivirus algeromassiliense]|jgi:hypothetical protein|uniref:Minor capsid protein P11 C-terminal conserved region domain-containing protein n=1 Tax=Fadolivirus FV1/VV64 TaxID=3070911 RepID=A0A7D3QX09_9VIRU|nr:hypothetical protein QKU48_gp0562 [Fadolivirus algeromassiliense]QKF94020.1 hypothetical protein Fadolivirus_1_562 [Fadolivirus FV1/VV64]